MTREASESKRRQCLREDRPGDDLILAPALEGDYVEYVAGNVFRQCRHEAVKMAGQLCSNHQFSVLERFGHERNSREIEPIDSTKSSRH